MSILLESCEIYMQVYIQYIYHLGNKLMMSFMSFSLNQYNNTTSILYFLAVQYILIPVQLSLSLIHFKIKICF